MNANEIVSEYAKLKAEIEQKQARLRELAGQIDGLAIFPEGKNTTHLCAAGYNVTIQRRQNIKWNQKALNDCRVKLGDDLFFKLFTWEFKANTRALTGFLDMGDQHQAAIIAAARTVTPGATQISLDLINQEGE